MERKQELQAKVMNLFETLENLGLCLSISSFHSRSSDCSPLTCRHEKSNAESSDFRQR